MGGGSGGWITMGAVIVELGRRGAMDGYSKNRLHFTLDANL